MKISPARNIGFKALLGKCEIKRNNTGSTVQTSIIQHLHPFSDEKDIKNLSDNYKNFLKNQMPYCKKIDVVVEPGLSFTKDEFMKAYKCPLVANISKSAQDFIKTSEFNKVITTQTGYMSAYNFENNSLNIIF